MSNTASIKIASLIDSKRRYQDEMRLEIKPPDKIINKMEPIRGRVFLKKEMIQMFFPVV